MDVMEEELAQLIQEMKSETKNDKFNPNSPKQVSVALFGTAGESTAKSVLEAVGVKNKLADKVLKYRQLKTRINKLKKRKENKDNGTFVRNVQQVQRVATKGARKTADSAKMPSSSLEQQGNEADTPTKPHVSQQQFETENSGDALILIDASAYIHRA